MTSDRNENVVCKRASCGRHFALVAFVVIGTQAGIRIADRVGSGRYLPAEGERWHERYLSKDILWTHGYWEWKHAELPVCYLGAVLGAVAGWALAGSFRWALARSGGRQRFWLCASLGFIGGVLFCVAMKPPVEYPAYPLSWEGPVATSFSLVLGLLYGAVWAMSVRKKER